MRRRVIIPSLAGLLFMALLVVSCGEKPQHATLPTTHASKGDSVSNGDPSPAPLLPRADASPSRATTPAGSWPSCLLVAAADLDGDGDDQVLCWDNGRLTFWTQGESGPYEAFLPPSDLEAKTLGAPSLLRAVDLDGDGREEVLAAFGMTRGQLEVPVTLLVIRLEGESGSHRRVSNLLFTAQSPRPEAVGLEVADLTSSEGKEILFAYFDSKYFVSSVILSPQKGDSSFKLTPQIAAQTPIRMATSWTTGLLPGRDLSRVFVGRPYGDEHLAPGDAFMLLEGKRDLIHTERGVRSLAYGDGDGDGHAELFFGDGWHQDYGKLARARLSVAKREAHGWATLLIHESPGQYEIRRIAIQDVDHDQRPEIIAAGNLRISAYWKTPDGWMTRGLAQGNDFALATIGGRDYLVVPGTPTSVVPLANARDGGQPVGWSEKEVASPAGPDPTGAQPSSPR